MSLLRPLSDKTTNDTMMSEDVPDAKPRKRSGKKRWIIVILILSAYLFYKYRYTLEDIHGFALIGNVELIQPLIQEGANINEKGPLAWTPLHVAVYYNQKEMVEYLLENGADVNARDLLGATPLYGSVEQANRIILWILLEHGADPTIGVRIGPSPLKRAKELGYNEIALLLEEQIERDSQ